MGVREVMRCGAWEMEQFRGITLKAFIVPRHHTQ